MNKLFLILWLMPILSIADIIPANRLPPAGTWEAAGVTGGIPERTTVFADATVDPYNADPTGSTNSTAAIQAALDACTSNQVVYLPEGTYLVSSLTIPSFVTLRGSGTNTLLVMTNKFTFTPTGLEFPVPITGDAITVTGGVTVGSTNVTMADTDSAAAGRIMQIAQADDYPTVWRNASSANGNKRGSVHIVTAVDANVSVTFWPPLAFDFTNTTICGFEGKAAKRLAGLEDLKVDASNVVSSASLGMISMTSTWDCWVTGVEIQNVPDKTIVITSSGRITISGNYFHDQSDGGNNSEGIDIADMVSWSLIEDNICVKMGFPSVVLGDGGNFGNVGNVIAYNYIVDSWFDLPAVDDFVMSGDISFAHGGHNMFNLVEGNFVGKINADSFHHSGEFGTILRNVATGQTTWENQIKRTAISLDRRHTSYSVVGNVLGVATNVADVEYATNSNWSGTAVFQLGFPNIGNNGYTYTYPDETNSLEHATDDTLDLYVWRDDSLYGTTIIEGNWNSVDDGQDWTITPETIPDSYYLGSKPEFFGSLAWPPVDPANPSDDPTILPAGYRFVNGEDPPAEADPPIIEKTSRAGSVTYSGNTSLE